MEQCSSFLPINSLATLKKPYLLNIVLLVTVSCLFDCLRPFSIHFSTLHRFVCSVIMDSISNRLSMFNVWLCRRVIFYKWKLMMLLKDAPSSGLLDNEQGNFFWWPGENGGRKRSLPWRLHLPPEFLTGVIYSECLLGDRRPLTSILHNSFFFCCCCLIDCLRIQIRFFSIQSLFSGNIVSSLLLKVNVHYRTGI